MMQYAHRSQLIMILIVYVLKLPTKVSTYLFVCGCRCVCVCMCVVCLCVCTSWLCVQELVHLSPCDTGSTSRKAVFVFTSPNFTARKKRGYM